MTQPDPLLGACQETTAAIDERLGAIDRSLEVIRNNNTDLWWIIRWLAGLSAAAVLLAIATAITFGILFSGARDHRYQLERSIAEQDVTKTRALCPLFRILTSFESPQGRASYPFGPEAYDRDMGQLRAGHSSLECHR